MDGQPLTAAPLATGATGSRVSPLACLQDLFLRPTVFFREIAPGLGLPVMGLAAWSAGVGIALQSGYIWWQGLPASHFSPDSWARYWTCALWLGLVYGIACLWVGGWWYKIRLGWCGAPDTDLWSAGRVCVLSWQVAAIPLFLRAVLQTCLYASPGTAGRGSFLDMLFSLAVLIWATIVSYCGVRTLLRVTSRPTPFWFVIVPVGLYVVGSLVLMASGAPPEQAALVSASQPAAIPATVAQTRPAHEAPAVTVLPAYPPSPEAHHGVAARTAAPRRAQPAARPSAPASSDAQVARTKTSAKAKTASARKPAAPRTKSAAARKNPPGRTKSSAPPARAAVATRSKRNR